MADKYNFNPIQAFAKRVVEYVKEKPKQEARAVETTSPRALEVATAESADKGARRGQAIVQTTGNGMQAAQPTYQDVTEGQSTARPYVGTKTHVPQPGASYSESGPDTKVVHRGGNMVQKNIAFPTPEEDVRNRQLAEQYIPPAIRQMGHNVIQKYVELLQHSPAQGTAPQSFKDAEQRLMSMRPAQKPASVDIPDEDLYPPRDEGEMNTQKAIENVKKASKNREQ